MKTLFISSFHPYIGRNILLTDAFRLLAERSDIRIVLFVHEYKKEYFTKHFARENVFVEGVRFSAPSVRRISLFFKRFAKYALHSSSVRIERRMKWKREGKFFYFIVMSFSSFLFRALPVLRIFLRAFDYRFSRRDMYREYFKRYQPDAVLVTDIQNERDVELAQNARFFGVALVGMVRAWDNLTLHGVLRIVPDKLFVPGEEMKREAMAYHGVPEKSIVVIGTPHYDKYVRGPAVSKDIFARNIGFDRAEGFLFYSLIGDRYIPGNDTDPYIIDVLKELGRQVYVRFSPTIPVRSLDGTEAPKGMYFDRPGVRFRNDSIGDQELSAADDDHLLAAIAYSDVVICGPSTIALDSVFLDKPVVLAGFHPRRRGYLEGAHRWDYNHFRYAIECGAVRLAKSKEELFRFISEYQQNPSRDSEKRRRLRDAYAGPRDGKSGERFAAALGGMLGV